ncbi:MAG TPA: 2-amino-4-hydroxy-6-hydroxymethyldihydropteridine diphosphokinase [Rhodobacteraceae bacterium]|nr:2-amino-4-hydroxy-6-hydroxymethyldihydropteridine diphosphokinase [Paracoccaceae bacterium]
MTSKQGQKTAKVSCIGYVALGSNLQTATRTSLEMVNEALGLFAGAAIRITKQSQWYSAPAFPAGSGPDYVNGVVEIESELLAQEVLDALHDIESQLGRTRPKRWASRVIDLDLLAFGDEIAPNPAAFAHWQSLSLVAQMEATPEGLILPHPRLQDRAFVLKPLAEIAPDWQHPVLGKSASALLAALPAEARNEIRPL